MGSRDDDKLAEQCPEKSREHQQHIDFPQLVTVLRMLCSLMGNNPELRINKYGQHNGSQPVDQAGSL
ncbi:hypothetical protein D3C75_1293950 [compost metagenome]